MARSVSEHGPHRVDRHVGRRLADRRISLGHNQSDLGRALGITFQQIQKYEKGTNRISSSRLWEAARFLDVEIGWFFEGLDVELVGVAEDSEADLPRATRHTVEISRLAPQLRVERQKLVLDMVKALTASGGVTD